jgi:hypothetical protein
LLAVPVRGIDMMPAIWFRAPAFAPNVPVPEAVPIAEVVRQLGFAGATFSSKGHGTTMVYHTDTLRMSPQDFEDTALALLEELVQDYPRLNISVQRLVIYMPRL